LSQLRAARQVMRGVVQALVLAQRREPARAVAAAAVADRVDRIDDARGHHDRGEKREQRKRNAVASQPEVGHCSLMAAVSDPEQSTTTGWPWRPGNTFRLLDGGGEFFPLMLEAIDTAHESVLLEMYLVHSGVIVTRFVAALGEAVRRGARV